ncbi:MAG: hypothetical protein WCP31_10440, partial [Chloroflexales bacterium]
GKTIRIPRVSRRPRPSAGSVAGREEKDPATFLGSLSAPTAAPSPVPTPPTPAVEDTRPLNANPSAPAPSPDKALPPPTPALTVPATAEPTPPRRRGGGRRRQDKQIRHKGLTRCDYPERHMVGYMVRVAWAGERRQKFFADTKHGDRLGALAAALDWRDQQERELGKPRTERLIFGKASSNTGIPGVTRLVRAGHPVLQVTWYENGRQRRTSISIDKHGERAALALARRIRADAEQRRLGRTARVVLATIQH